MSKKRKPKTRAKSKPTAEPKGGGVIARTDGEIGNLITTGKAGAMLNVSRQTIARWVREGNLRAIHLPSGYLRILETDVQNILSKVQVTP